MCKSVQCYTPSRTYKHIHKIKDAEFIYPHILTKKWKSFLFLFTLQFTYSKCLLHTRCPKSTSTLPVKKKIKKILNRWRIPLFCNIRYYYRTLTYHSSGSTVYITVWRFFSSFKSLHFQVYIPVLKQNN